MKYFNELPSKTYAAFKRFPLTILWSVLGSGFLIILILVEANIFDNYNAELLTLILGVSWLIGAQFFTESLVDKKKGWFLKITIIVFLIVYYFSLPKNDFSSNPIVYIRWFLLLLAGHVFIFFAPFLKKWNKTDYWNYLQRIIIAIARSSLFSFVIFSGVSLAILAIDNLFNIAIDDKIYLQLWVACVGIINTFIYLSDFPKKIYDTQQLYYTKALDVFLKFILIPILSLYLFIVYAYSIKIFIAWELPKGWVSYLISILAIIGFIIQIIIEPIRKTHPNQIIKKFYPLFYLLLLPLLVLLFVAIYTRISDYSFTENRYFLMLLGVWILGMSLYMLFSKKKRLSLFPISLFILCVLASYGPWSAFNVSVKAQVNELKQIVSEIKNKENQLISQEKANQFKSIARYLKERDKLFLADEFLGFKTNYITNRYSSGNYILDSLYGKEKAKQFSNSTYYNNNHYYYNSYNNNKGDKILVKDYDYFVEVNLSNYHNANYQFSHSPKELKLQQGENLLFTFNLDEKLLKTLSAYPDLKSAPKESFTYIFSNDIGSYKLIIRNFNFEKIDANSIKLRNLSAYVLIGYKKY